MLKKKILIFILSVALVVAGVLPVSAVYVTMLDNGLYYMRDGVWSPFPTTLVRATYISPMWAIDELQVDTTYTCNVTFTVKTNGEMGVSKLFNYSGCNYNNALSFLYTSSDADDFFVTSEITPFYDGTAGGASVTFKYDLTIKFNSKNISGSPLYIYAFYISNGSGNFSWVTLNSLGMSAEYDPNADALNAEILDTVKGIRSDNENFYSNAPEIIKNALSDHDQDVKNEASTEGNDNITEATSALTNALPIASISDALAPLVTACSYNGTKSIWTFPELSIPAISGLFGEMKLSEKQDFDLTEYAELYIPDQLLTLIRAVTTLLLIIWAIKECQSVLSTLLGGDKYV